MQVKYYGMQTKSGSWYLVKARKHTLGKTEWTMYMKNNEFHVVALVDSAVAKEVRQSGKIAEAFQAGTLIAGVSVGHSQQFEGRIILFGREAVPAAFFEEPVGFAKKLSGTTTAVGNVIEFK